MKTMKCLVFLIAVLAQARSQTREGDSCVETYTKTIGKCTPADACTTARNDYQQNGIRPTFCTYSAFGTTLVCCRDGSSILNAAGSRPQPPPVWNSDPNRQSDNRRVSERNDEEITSTRTYPADEGISEDNHDQIKRTLTVNEKPKISESPTEEDLLSKLWAMKLKKLTNEQRRYAEKIINDVLFEAQNGSLTENHLKLLSCNFTCDNDTENSAGVKISTRLGEQRKVKIRSPLIHLQLSVNNPEDKTDGQIPQTDNI